jgi:hypothetical protein
MKYLATMTVHWFIHLACNFHPPTRFSRTLIDSLRVLRIWTCCRGLWKHYYHSTTAPAAAAAAATFIQWPLQFSEYICRHSGLFHSNFGDCCWCCEQCYCYQYTDSTEQFTCLLGFFDLTAACLNAGPRHTQTNGARCGTTDCRYIGGC